jgi:hypothetical protein
VHAAAAAVLVVLRQGVASAASLFCMSERQHREDSHFKRPFGVEGEVPNGHSVELGLLMAAAGWSGVGVELLRTSGTPFNGQAAGPTAQLRRVRFSGRSARHGSFTSARHGPRRRTSLQPSIQAHMLEDACNDTWIGNGANHLQCAATMGALAQVNREYPLQADHPAHWRRARLRCRFIVGRRLARYLGTRHDGRSIAGIGVKQNRLERF